MPSRPPSQAPTSRNKRKGYIQIVYRGPIRPAATASTPNASNTKPNSYLSLRKNNGGDTCRNKKNEKPIPVRLQNFDEWIHIGLCDESIDGASLPPLTARGMRMPPTKKKPNTCNEIIEHRQDDEAALLSVEDAKRENSDEKENKDVRPIVPEVSSSAANKGGIESENADATKKGNQPVLSCVNFTDLKKSTSGANEAKMESETAVIIKKNDLSSRTIGNEPKESTPGDVAATVRSETTELPSIDETGLEQKWKTAQACALVSPKQDVSVLSKKQRKNKSSPVRYECSCDLPTAEKCNLQVSYLLDIMKKFFCSLPECTIPVEIEIQEQHFPCSTNASDDQQGPFQHQTTTWSALSPPTLEHQHNLQHRKNDTETKKISDTSSSKSKDRPLKNKRTIEPQVLPRPLVLQTKPSPTKVMESIKEHTLSKVGKEIGATFKKVENRSTSSKTDTPSKSNNSTGNGSDDISSISTSSVSTNGIALTGSKVEIVFEVASPSVHDNMSTDRGSKSGGSMVNMVEKELESDVPVTVVMHPVVENPQEIPNPDSQVMPNQAIAKTRLISLFPIRMIKIIAVALRWPHI